MRARNSSDIRPPHAAFVLASGSPRRRQLLQQAGFRFEIDVPAVQEHTTSPGGPEELARTNARLKAHAVAVRRPGDVILAADTIVVFDGEIFGKPRDMEAARAMLRRLAGNTHDVLTAVAVRRDRDNRWREFVTRTRVRFLPMTPQAVDAYLRDINPLDKAGAYAAQDDNGRLIAAIDGSFDNVVGLPVAEVAVCLREAFGVLPDKDLSRSNSRSGGKA